MSKKVTIHLLVPDPEHGRIAGLPGADGNPIMYSPVCDRGLALPGPDVPVAFTGEAARTNCPECRKNEVWLHCFKTQYRRDPKKIESDTPHVSGPVPMSVVLPICLQNLPDSSAPAESTTSKHEE